MADPISPFCKIISLSLKNIYKNKDYNDLFQYSKSLLFGIGNDLWSDTDKSKFTKYILEKQSHLTLVLDAAGITKDMIKSIELRNHKMQNIIIVTNVIEVKKMLNARPCKKNITDFSIRNNCYFLYKGTPFILSTPLGKTKIINVKSMPKMATQGMGDILSGFLTGLLARDFTPEKAIKSSIMIRQEAGELFLKENKGYLSVTPECALNYFPEAIVSLKNKKCKNIFAKI